MSLYSLTRQKTTRLETYSRKFQNGFRFDKQSCGRATENLRPIRAGRPRTACRSLGKSGLLRVQQNGSVSFSFSSLFRYAYMSYHLPEILPASDSFTIKNIWHRKKRKRRWRRNLKFWYIERKSGSRWLTSGAPSQRKRNCRNESTKAFRTKCVSWQCSFCDNFKYEDVGGASERNLSDQNFTKTFY